MTHEARVSLTPLVDALCTHRQALLILYAVSLVVVMAGAYAFGLAFPEWFHALRGVPSDMLDRPEPFDVAIALGIFVLAHIAFLWGGGRITLGTEPAGAWRLIVPVAVATLLLVILVGCLAASMLDMFDRLETEGALRDEETSLALFDLLDRSGTWWWLLGIWLFWSAIGIFLLRSRDQYTALTRLVTALLATSWVEFLVALPVDIAVRQRSDSCPCATGSWLALFAAVPILLFSFGPGLLFLYMREWRLAAAEPTHALRILMRKSRRAG